MEQAPRWQPAFDKYVQENIPAIKEAQVRSVHASGVTRDRLEILEEDNLRLRLVVAALVEHLIAKGLATREELAQVAEKIDALDGKVDGHYDGRIDIRQGPGPRPPAPPVSPLDELKKVVEEG